MSEQKKQNLADPSVRKRFVTYKEATELYSMGLTRIQEHAKIAGATYKMGNKVLVNTDIFEAYLEQFRIPVIMKEWLGSLLRILQVCIDKIFQLNVQQLFNI